MLSVRIIVILLYRHEQEQSDDFISANEYT